MTVNALSSLASGAPAVSPASGALGSLGSGSMGSLSSLNRGYSAGAQQVTIIPSRALGPFTDQITIEEEHNDELAVTEHPVEQGARISDHAYRVPSELSLELGWSNSSVAGGGDESYVMGVYARLLALQQTREPFAIVTGKRAYVNMLLTSLSVHTERDSETSLMVRATCREVLITQTSATTMPPAVNQSLPAKTQETTAAGSKQLITPTATPKPGAFIKDFGVAGGSSKDSWSGTAGPAEPTVNDITGGWDTTAPGANFDITGEGW